MNLADIRFLFAYDCWATRRVLAAVAGLRVAEWPAGEPIGERHLGEIGGAAEEEAAAWAAEHLRGVPMAAFIAGRTAPEGKRMGHAGAIISGGRGTAAEKVAALEAAGIRVASSPTELPALLREAGHRG